MPPVAARALPPLSHLETAHCSVAIALGAAAGTAGALPRAAVLRKRGSLTASTKAVEVLTGACAPQDGGVQHLLATLEAAGALLRELGAPAREAAAAAAAAGLRGSLGAALAARDSAAAAAGAARALALLAAQLRLLRVDAANWQLRALAAGLAGGAGLAHARTAFLAAHGLPDPPPPAAAVAALPHARAWLAAASGRLPAHALALEPATALAAAAAAAGARQDHTPAAAAGAPAALRAGRGAAAAAAAAAAGAGARGTGAALPAATLVVPVAPGSWRGVLRLGLVDLVAAEAPVAGAGAGLPETLRADAGRLDAAQHGFQQLLVAGACLLVVRQARAGAAAPVRALP